MPRAVVAKSVFIPQIKFTASYMTGVVAMLGTTISPYLFTWQAEEEVEEVKERPDAKPLELAPEQPKPEFRRIRIDTYVGLAFSNAVALFIILTTAATLHAHGVTDIQTSSQAAEPSGPSPDRSPLRSLRSASSAPGFWPYPYWPGLPPMPWVRPSAGMWASPANQAGLRRSTRPSPPRRWLACFSTTAPSTRSRRCSGAR